MCSYLRQMTPLHLHPQSLSAMLLQSSTPACQAWLWTRLCSNWKQVFTDDRDAGWLPARALHDLCSPACCSRKVLLNQTCTSVFCP